MDTLTAPSHQQVHSLSTLTSTSTTSSSTTSATKNSTVNVNANSCTNNHAHSASTIPTTDDILGEALSICQEQWVSDFLFSKEMTPLSALLAPINTKYAIPSTFQLTSVECNESLRPGSPMNHMFDMQMAGDIIFIPAFSINSKSVGFGVQQNSILARSKWGYNTQRQQLREFGHFRYVRCDKLNILLSFHDDVKSDIIRIDTSQIISLKKRKRCMILLRRNLFYSKFLNCNSLHKNIYQIAKQCLLLTHFSCHCRSSCPFCQAPNTTCNCQLAKNVIPKHPYDFSTSVRNMARHVGTYQGVSTEHYYENGMLQMSKKMGSRISISRSHEDNLIERLSTWAINDQMKYVKLDPVKLVMPASNQNSISNDNGCMNYNNLSISNNNNINNNNNTNTNTNTNTTTNNNNNNNNNNNHNHNHFENYISTTNPLIGSLNNLDEETYQYHQSIPLQQEQQQYGLEKPVQMIEETKSVPFTDIRNSNSNNIEIMEIDRMFSETEMETENNVLYNSNSNVLSNNNNIPNMIVENGQQPHQSIDLNDIHGFLSNISKEDQQHLQLQQQQQQLNMKEEQGQEEDFGGEEQEETYEEQEDNMDEVALTERIANEAQAAFESENAGWPTDTNSQHNQTSMELLEERQQHEMDVFYEGTNACSSVESIHTTTTRNGAVTKSSKEIDRERRAELRRQRNREAAQRSNLRRKLKNDTLKRDLRHAHEKASQLRAHELLLREENIKLRKLLSTQ